jgi:peptidoglycan/xylan/chitin deacetylase (PgdA/CDA1 family)
MPSRKSQLASIMSRTGALHVARAARGLVTQEVPILAYHRVLDGWSEGSFPFDLELISATTREFRWQMEFVARHYNPITFSQLISATDGDGSLPPRPLIVTFDDGFDDNFHNAFPILRELGVPATFFISTSYIGQHRTFWFDWFYRLCQQQLKKGGVQFGQISVAQTHTPHAMQEAMGKLFAHAKSLPDELLRERLTALEREAGETYPEGGYPESRPMTWDHVRQMAAAGMEFGSHTATHPILTNLKPDALQNELSSSRAELEAQLNRPAAVLSYPNGDINAFSADVIAAAKNAGYRFATSYINGTNHLRKLNDYCLRRLHVERYTSRSDFAGMLAFPEALS